MLYKFPNSYIKDAYSFYKDKILSNDSNPGKPLTEKEFKKINRLYCKFLVDYVLLGREVGLPNGVGTIIIAKSDKKNRNAHVNSYSQTNKNINKDETVVLDKYSYKVKFRRNGLVPGLPITGFKFIPAWSFKESLRLLIKGGYGGRYSYLTSKTLHRDEI